MLLHTGALDAGGVTHNCLYAEILVHRCFDTLIRVHSALRTHSFTQRFLYTHCVQALLHRELLTHSGRRIYMQIFLHGKTYFVHVSFYIHACSFTGILSIIHAFNHTCFYTEMFLHRDTFTQRCFCTGMLSCTEMIFCTHTFTER
jgi:hypothetical protein